MKLYEPVVNNVSSLMFKVFRMGAPVELSDAIPMLENLGLRVISEHPYQMQRDGKPAIWLHKFSLVYDLPAWVDVPSVKDSFQHAFEAIWRGEAESEDRKSTRLNSSHVAISYAVFCL